MKKYLIGAAAICCMLISGVALTACGGDDEPSNSTEDKKPAKVAMKFNYSLSQDVLDYCDVVITYNDGTGAKTETMTSTTWSKTVSAQLPVDFSFSRKVTLKSGKDITKATSLTISRNYSYSYELFDEAGKTLNSGNYTGTGSSITSAGSAAAALVNEGRLNDSHSYSFDANGVLKQ